MIVPAAAARRFATTPEQMVAAATVIGIVSVVAGLFAALHWDLPAGPAIVLVASGIFLAGLLVPVRGYFGPEDRSADRSADRPHAP